MVVVAVVVVVEKLAKKEEKPERVKKNGKKAEESITKKYIRYDNNRREWLGKHRRDFHEKYSTEKERSLTGHKARRRTDEQSRPSQPTDRHTPPLSFQTDRWPHPLMK